MNGKKGNTSIIIIDVMAFFLMAVGAGLVRYAQNEVVSISGGVIVAIGLALLSISRYLIK